MLTLPANVAERIRACVEAGEGPAFAIDQEARKHNAIALMGTIGVIWGLRTDGTFWQFDEDWGLELTLLPQELTVQALVYGSQRHPWLAELLPMRPTDAGRCDFCRGTGKLGRASLCQKCQGLGWIDA